MSGAPTNAFQAVVQMTAQGGLNTAAFKLSINGGHSYTDEITVPVTGSYAVEGTGLTIQFSEAEEEDQKPASFLAGDTFTFSSTAPAMTNGDVLAAANKLKAFSQAFEFIHIVGESGLPLWQAMSESQRELMDTYHKPAFVLLEAAPPAAEADLHGWAFQMEADRRKVRNSNIQVCAAWGQLVRLDGTTQAVNLAGLVSGRYELLDNAGYLTVREYDGLDDRYVYHIL